MTVCFWVVQLLLEHQKVSTPENYKESLSRYTAGLREETNVADLGWEVQPQKEGLGKSKQRGGCENPTPPSFSSYAHRVVSARELPGKPSLNSQLII